MRDDELLAAAADEWRMTPDIADAGGIHVGGGQDRQHASRAARPLDIDDADLRKGMRRAHEVSDGLVRRRAISNEMTGAA